MFMSRYKNAGRQRAAALPQVRAPALDTIADLPLKPRNALTASRGATRHSTEGKPMEKLAFQFLALGEGHRFAIGALVVVTGFVLGMWSRRGAEEAMTRSAYALQTVGLFALACLLPALAGLEQRAFLQGWLWLLLLVAFAGAGLAGFASARLAHPRAVDAFGRGGGAWLALVPLVNLVLFVWPPQDRREARGDVAMAAAIGALVLLGLAALITTANERMARQRDRALASDSQAQAATLTRMQQLIGLEATLRRVAANMQRSRRIDYETTLISFRAEGSTLHQRYRTRTGRETLAVDWQVIETRARARNCTDLTALALLDGGARFVLSYHFADDSLAGEVVLTRADCPP